MAHPAPSASAAAPAAPEDETALPRIPDLAISHSAYLLAQPSYHGDKQKLKEELLAKIKANRAFSLPAPPKSYTHSDMVSFYETLCHQHGWHADAHLVKEMNHAITTKEAQLDVRNLCFRYRSQRHSGCV